MKIWKASARTGLPRNTYAYLAAIGVLGAVWMADAVIGKGKQVAPPAPVRMVLPETPLPLDQKQREFLWAVEHHGQVMSKKGFVPLANALSADDRESFIKLLAADFVGQVPRLPTEVKLSTDSVSVTRQADAGQQQDLGRDDFTATLFSFRQGFFVRQW